ncbi:MAG: hypothetical protein AAFW97_16650 [Pseudomonadota bacterium]
MTPDDEDLIRSRQKSRALVTALILGGLAILFYLITITKLVVAS